MMMMNTMHVLLAAFLVLLFHFFNELFLKPRSLRSKLEKQDIHGPSPHFYFGNIPEKKMLIQQAHSDHASKQDKDKDIDKSDSISHNWYSTLFPHVVKWRKQYDVQNPLFATRLWSSLFTSAMFDFKLKIHVENSHEELISVGPVGLVLIGNFAGPLYLFSSGKTQWLVVSDKDMVKEITLYTSLNLGKPSSFARELGPLLGQGIFSSSGQDWVQQRKIIASALYLDKVKEMVNLIVGSTKIILQSWESRLEREGVASDIKVDDDLRSLSADIIAKACFGINYVEGKEIFSKLRELQKLLSTIDAGIPGQRYLPTRRNREIWRLDKEIKSKILKIVNQRSQDAKEHDLLQMLIEGVKNSEGSDGFLSNSSSSERFIIDNCKNIFFAGHETTAITASWCLMLLAMHQDWQDRVRAEVLEVCGNNPPDASMLRSLKTLNMVIQETMRLYPSAAFVSRTAFQDIRLNGILIPKGMNIEILIPVLMQDPEIWGNDALNFNPERFSNGVIGSSKFPQAYAPFGLGARVCVGLNLAMTELKVVLSLILMKFRVSISPSYCHSPTFHLVIEPGHGILLKMTRI